MNSARVSTLNRPRPPLTRYVHEHVVPRDWGGAVVLVVAATLIGLVLRLPWIGDSLYGDELSSFYVVTGHSFGQVLHLLNGHTTELNPPLYFVLAWLSEQVAGSSVESLRFISLLSGVAIIPLTYLLGRWTVGSRAGLVGAAAAALSPFLIFYASEARAYSLMIVLCLVSTLALLRSVSTGRPWWWVAYAACSCAAMYTHFTSVFVLIAQFGWAFITQPRARRALLVANVAVAIGFVPWLPVLIRASHSPLTTVYGALGPFTVLNVRLDLEHVAIGHPLVPIAAIPGKVGAAAVLAGAAIAVVGTILRAAADRVPRHWGWRSPEVWLIVVLACATPVGVAIYSVVGNSIWDARNLLASWPGFATLVGALLTYPRLRWGLPAVCLVLCGLVIGAVRMQQSRYHRPDYLAVARYMDRVGTDHEPAVNWPDLTPGPPTELEAAMTLAGAASRHPVIRLGLAPLPLVLRASPSAILNPLPGELVGRIAVRQAGQRGLFLVLPVGIPVSTLEVMRRAHLRAGATTNFLALLASFLRALPPNFHVIAVHSFSGLNRVTVYTFTP